MKSWYLWKKRSAIYETPSAAPKQTGRASTAPSTPDPVPERLAPRSYALLLYPRTQRLTPALYDPELERLVRRGLAKARELLARRGSTAIIKCVLFEVAHGEVFWVGEER